MCCAASTRNRTSSRITKRSRSSRAGRYRFLRAIRNSFKMARAEVLVDEELRSREGVMSYTAHWLATTLWWVLFGTLLLSRREPVGLRPGDALLRGYLASV